MSPLVLFSPSDDSVTLSKLDAIGSAASLCCAVHCVALPFVITLLPLIGLGFLSSEKFELGMIVFSIGLASLSLCWGHRIHKNRNALYLIPLALSFFITAHIFENNIHWVFMALGGTALASGHFVNRSLCKSCHMCNPKTEISTSLN